MSFAVSTKEPDDGNGVLTYVKPAKNPNRGEWFHMVGTYDGGTIKLYINGKVVAENKSHKGDINYPNAKDGNGENDAELIIGQFRDKNEFFPHKGLIDEVKIYNRALSEVEVKHNMKSSGVAPLYITFTDIEPCTIGEIFSLDLLGSISTALHHLPSTLLLTPRC